MFEFSAEDTLLGEIWRTKFEDKSKSLVKSIREEIPIVLTEQVFCLFIICIPITVPWVPSSPCLPHGPRCKACLSIRAVL